MLSTMLFWVPRMARASGIWSTASRATYARLEWMRPQFAVEPDDHYRQEATLLSLDLGIKLSERANLRLDFPFMWATSHHVESSHFNGSSDQTFALAGMPYVGIELMTVSDDGQDVRSAEVGVRLPVFPEEYSSYGLSPLLRAGPRYIDDPSAFVIGAIPLTMIMHTYPNRTKTVQWESHIGMQLLFPILPEGSSQRVSPLPFFAYSARPWIKASDRLRLGAGIAGRIPIPAIMAVSQYFWHEAAVSAELTVGSFRPRVEYRVPLSDGLQSVMDGAFVVQLDYLF